MVLRIVDVAVYYILHNLNIVVFRQSNRLGIVETWGGEGHRIVVKFRCILYHNGLGLNATFTS